MAFVTPFITSENGRTRGVDVRNQALSALNTLRFPTRKTEDWKYTPLRKLEKRHFRLNTGKAVESIEPFLIPGLEADLLVFVNGRFDAALSRLELNQDVLTVSTFRDLEDEALAAFEAHFGKIVPAETDVFSALNTAYAHEGVFIHLKKSKVAAAPIHILHLSAPGEEELGMQHRNLFVVEAQAEAKVLETQHSLQEGVSFRNSVTEIFLGANAGLEYIKIQRESDQATQIDRTEIRQEQDSRFSIYTLTFSGDIVRNNLRIRLNGENTETNLMGLYLLSGQQHVDNFTIVDHAKPHCYSNELYKGIMDEESTGVFSGRINVFQDAQKTNAYQSNRNIVLTDKANVYTKPQLEIYADDVKCSHGATTGRLEESAMFYLRSRGIKEAEARKMLVHAFAMEVVENINLEPVVEYVDQLITDRY
jgi:Fe-S cluster assembly protein SufD